MVWYEYFILYYISFSFIGFGGNELVCCMLTAHYISCSITDVRFLFLFIKINKYIRFDVWFNHWSGKRKAIGNECIPCRRRALIQNINWYNRAMWKRFICWRSKKRWKKRKKKKRIRWTENWLRSNITVIQYFWINCSRSDLLQYKVGNISIFIWFDSRAYYMQSNCHQHCIANIKWKIVAWNECNPINSDV